MLHNYYIILKIFNRHKEGTKINIENKYAAMIIFFELTKPVDMNQKMNYELCTVKCS